MRAAAIVMPLPRRVAGNIAVRQTVETVLAERRCRVIIESTPDGDSRHQRRVVEKASTDTT